MKPAKNIFFCGWMCLNHEPDMIQTLVNVFPENTAYFEALDIDGLIERYVGHRKSRKDHYLHFNIQPYQLDYILRDTAKYCLSSVTDFARPEHASIQWELKSLSMLNIMGEVSRELTRTSISRDPRYKQVFDSHMDLCQQELTDSNSYHIFISATGKIRTHWTSVYRWMMDVINKTEGIQNLYYHNAPYDDADLFWGGLMDILKDIRDKKTGGN